MKITIMTGPFYSVPPAPCGAVERVWFDLAREFAARGHEVSIAARAYPGLPGEEVREGVRVFRRFSYARTGSLKWDLVKDLAYSAQSAAVLPRGDILVTNAFWMPAVAGVARRSAGRLVVNLNRFPKGQLWLYAAAARFTAVSRAVRDAAVEQYPRAARITRVLPNPIDTGVFSPPVSPRTYGDSPVVLFTGRVHPEKGLDLLVRAYAELRRVVPGVRLRLVGPVEVERGGGGEAYVRELREMAGGAPIEVPGPVYDRAALCRELREARVYCYPSRAERGEALPVAPLEAMATGLVPVVSDLAVFRDYVEPGVTGFVFDHRGESAATNLAAALRSALADPARLAEVGRAAAAKAGSFSNQNVAKMYLRDFEELLGHDRRRT